MANTDPINIKFLINNAEVKKMAAKVKATIRGTTSTATEDAAKMGNEFNAIFSRISTKLKDSFGAEKIQQLDQELQGVTDEGKQFSTVLDFIKTNLADLKMNPEDSEEAIANIERIEQSLQEAATGAEKMGQATSEAFDLSGMSVEEMKQRLSELVLEEKRLQAELSKAPKGEQQQKYNQSLQRTRSEANALQGALAKMTTSGTAGMNSLAKIGERLGGSFRNISSVLKTAFGSERIQLLNKQLQAATQEGEQLGTVLNFIQANLGDLRMNPEGSEEAIANIERLQEALKQASNDSARFGQTTAEAFDLSGMSVTQMEARLDELIKKEGVLMRAQTQTFDPASLQGYEAGLVKTRAEMNALAGALDKANAKKLSGELDDTGKAAKKAGKGIGTMTKEVDATRALSEGMRGLFGSISSVVLVTQMLAGDNDEVGKTMMKLFGVYMVIMGVMDAMHAVSGKSQLMTLLRAKTTRKLTTAKEAETTATAAQTGATKAQTAATEGGIAAQEGMNAAMGASPIGIAVLAVTALATAYITLANSAADAQEIQEQLNTVLSDTIDYYETINELADEQFQKRIDKMKDELAVMQAQGKSQSKLAAQRLKIANAEANMYAASKARRKMQLDGVTEALKANGIEIKSMDQLSQKLTQLKKKRMELDDELLKKKEGPSEEEKIQKSVDQAQQSLNRLKSPGASTFGHGGGMIPNNLYGKGKSAKDIQKELDALNPKIEGFQKVINFLEKGTKPGSSEKTKLAEAQQAAAELAQSQKQRQADAKAGVEAEIEGTKEWLAAQKKAIETARQIKIENANGVQSIIRQANVEAANKEAAAERKHQDRELGKQEATIKTRLAKAVEGSKEEMQARIDLVKVQAEEEENQAGLTAEKKVEIATEAEEKISDIRKAYHEQVSEEELETEEANLQAKLAKAKEGSQQQLKLHKKLLKNKADQDLLQAEKEIHNQKLLAATKKQIHAQLLADLSAADDKHLQDKLQKELNDIDKKYQASAVSSKNQSGFNPVGKRTFRDEQEILAVQNKINAAKEKQNVLEKALGVAMSKGSDSSKKIKKQLDGTNDKLKGFKKALEKIKKQKAADILFDIGQGFKDLGNSLSGLGDAISDTNEGLGDTINVAGQLLGAVGDLATGIASGNPAKIIGAVVKGVTTVLSLGAKARESARKAQEEIEKYQQKQITGALEYNRILRQRKRDQADITKMTLEELRANKQNLQEQLKSAKAEKQKWLTKIQQEGKEVVGHHKKKYGGFLGIGRKTKVVDEFADLTAVTAEQLEEMDLEGKLVGPTKEWYEEMKKSQDGIDEINDALDQSSEKIAEMATGTMADSIADNIANGFIQGKRSAADFAGDFKDLMKNSFISIFKSKILGDSIRKFYKNFKDAAKDGQVTEAERNALKVQYDQDIANAKETFTQMTDSLGLDFSDQSGLTGLSGAISRTITEDTANELSGLMRGEYGVVKRQLSVLSRSLETQLQIEANTANMVVRMDGALVELKNINNNTKPSQSSRDQGLDGG